MLNDMVEVLRIIRRREGEDVKASIQNKFGKERSIFLLNRLLFTGKIKPFKRGYQEIKPKLKDT